jgi:hypothetical protein
MTGDPGRGTVPCQLTRHATPSRSALDRHGDGQAFGIYPRRIAAPDVRQHRPGWHARDIAVEKAGQ